MDISVSEKKMQKSIAVFCCYAHEDEEFLNKLKSHLRPLQHQGLITVWHDRNISAGAVWEEEIKRHLSEAQIILLLISPAFMDSEYCYGIEMQHALKRHKDDEATVVPVILRHTYWHEGPLGDLQALPTDGRPVASRAWSNEDEAFYTIVLGIRSAVETIITKGEQLRKAEEERQAHLVEQARLAEVERIRRAEEMEQARERKKESQRRAKEEQKLKAREEQTLQAEEEKIRILKDVIQPRETEERVSSPEVLQQQMSAQFSVSTSTVFPSQHPQHPQSFDAPMASSEPAGRPLSSFISGALPPIPVPDEKQVENAPLTWAGILRGVRNRTLPADWRVFSPFDASFITYISFIICGFIGFCIFFIVLTIADSLPVIHNLFVQMHINMSATGKTSYLPDSLQWVQWFPFGIGGILGSVYAWKRKMSFVLVLLPYGFVYGRRGQKQAFLAVNFQEIAAMSVLLPNDVIVTILSTGLTKAFIKQFWNRLKVFPHGLLNKALSVTLFTSDGKTSTIVQKMHIDSYNIQSVIATYEQFKARSSL